VSARTPSFTPEIELQTLFVLNDDGRIRSTREPNPNGGPIFSLIRGRTHCAWAVHADVPETLAREVGDLARAEPAGRDFESAPKYAKDYLSLLGGKVDAGPTFIFPQVIPRPDGIVSITHLAQLQHHFRGWTADEIPERSPILAIVEDERAISVCFCARRSAVAAEAGVETAERFRGRGLAARVTAAWALGVRTSGRLPVYSTSWSNEPSLAVARTLGLEVCASVWSLYGAYT